MAYEDLQHIEGAMVIAPTITSIGTQCIGMTMNGQVLVQARKGTALFISALVTQLASDSNVQEILQSDGPIESIVGMAIHTAKSHAGNKIVIEDNTSLVGLYVRSAIAECMAAKGMTQLDKDFS